MNGKKKKLIYEILKDVEKGVKEPMWNKYVDDKEIFGEVIEIMQEQELIEGGEIIRGGREKKVEFIMLKEVRIKSKGLTYLNEFER